MKISGVKRIVVKVGTNTIMKGDKVSREIIALLAEQLSKQVKSGREVILVSSGAVGLGSEKLGIKPKNLSAAAGEDRRLE